MSERSTAYPSEATGWHAPDTPLRELPTTGIETPRWQLATLPETLDAAPQQPGLWHLPAPEDTPFSSQDRSVVTSVRPPTSSAVLLTAAAAPAAPRPEDIALAASKPESKPLAARPEDEIFNLVREVQREAGLEDEETVQGVPAPEDNILAVAANAESELEALREEADDFFDASMTATEIDALQSMMTGDEAAAGMGALAALAEPEAGTAAEPHPDDSQPTAVDPAEVARRRLAELEAESDEGTPYSALDAAPAAASTAAEAATSPYEDPAEVARRRLEELRDNPDLSITAQGTALGTAPLAPVLSPQEEQLARQFEFTEQQVRTLRDQFYQGRLSREDLELQLRDLMVLDDKNTYWMMGVESDLWYKFEDDTWKPAEPPLLDALRQQEQSLSGYAPAQPGAGYQGLDYLEESAQPGTSGTQEWGGAQPGGLRVDENYMPLPQQVSARDPEATMVGPAAFKDQQTFAQATLAGATVPSAAVSYPQEVGIPAPYAEPVAAPVAEGESEYERAVQRRRSNTTRNVIFALIGMVALVLLAATGVVLLALSQYNNIRTEWDEPINNLLVYAPEFQDVTILDVNGNPIAELSSRQGARQEISIDRMSPFVLHAVISSEDRRFYENAGWDLPRIVNAFFGNLVAGEIESGASTITQQIARNLVLIPSGREFGSEYERKLHELVIANEIAVRYSKTQILELYMNSVFFGNLSTGVEAASRFYFGVPASDLNTAQGAMLTAIIPAPGILNPVDRSQWLAIRDATQNVLQDMLDVGCIQFQHGVWAQTGDPFCINRNTTVNDGGQTQPLFDLGTNNTLRYNENGDIIGGIITVQLARLDRNYEPRNIALRYPHFVDYIRLQLEDIYGAEGMFEQGLTVRTTIDPRVQDFAEDAIVAYMPTLRGTGVNSGAILVSDPRTGAIRAMIGSPDFTDERIDGQVNNTRAWHQPGSTIKVITYTAAISGVDLNGNGVIEPGEYLTPASILWDVPFAYPDGTQIRNFSGTFSGPVPVRGALQNSLNVPAVKAFQFVGAQNWQAFAERMGLEFLPEAQITDATALGATDVRLFDMVEAYGTIASGGSFVPLYGIEEVTTASGENVTPPRVQPAAALAPEVAFVMQDVLSDDTARQPAFAPGGPLTISGLPRQDVVAAKTGTTDGGRDLWTIGFTNNWVVGVWMGTFNNAETQGTFAALVGAPIWNQVMTRAVQVAGPSQFQPPANGNVVSVTVCSVTGAQFGDGSRCPVPGRSEIALRTQPPPGADFSFLVDVPINSWTGLLANEACPQPENILLQRFVNLSDQSAVNWLNTPSGQGTATLLGLPQPVQAAPTQGCTAGVTIPVVSLSEPFENQTLTGNAPVVGTINAGVEFAYYELSIADVNRPDQFGALVDPNGNTIGRITTQPGAGSAQLAIWNTARVPNGTYILRLEVGRSGGGFVRRTVRVNVNNVPPTATPSPILPTATPSFSTPLPFDTPIPFDPLSTPFGGGSQNVAPTQDQGFVLPPSDSGPTPTLDPLG